MWGTWDKVFDARLIPISWCVYRSEVGTPPTYIIEISFPPLLYLFCCIQTSTISYIKHCLNSVPDMKLQIILFLESLLGLASSHAIFVQLTSGGTTSGRFIHFVHRETTNVDQRWAMVSEFHPTMGWVLSRVLLFSSFDTMLMIVISLLPTFLPTILLATVDQILQLLPAK